MRRQPDNLSSGERRTGSLPRPALWFAAVLLAFAIALLSVLLVPHPKSPAPWKVDLLMSIPYGVFILSFFLLSRSMLGAGPREVLTSNRRFSPLRLLSYAFVWIALLGLFACFRSLFEKGLYHKAPGYVLFSAPLLAVLVFTPLQTFSEELVFRCAFSKMVDDDLPNKTPGQTALWSLVSGALFALAHLGTIASKPLGAAVRSALFFFLLGAFLMWLGLASGGFEPALGIHLGNNLFFDLVACPSASPRITHPAFLFEGEETSLLVAELLFCALGAFAFFKFSNKEAPDAQG